MHKLVSKCSFTCRHVRRVYLVHVKKTCMPLSMVQLEIDDCGVLSSGDGNSQVLWVFVSRGHFQLMVPLQTMVLMRRADATSADAGAEDKVDYMLVPHGMPWLFMPCFS